MKKTFILIIHTLSVLLFAAGLSVIYMISPEGFGVSWIGEEDFAQSPQFAQMVDDDIGLIKEYAILRDTFEENGEISYDKVIVTAETQNGLTSYSLRELSSIAADHGCSMDPDTHRITISAAGADQDAVDYQLKIGFKDYDPDYYANRPQGPGQGIMTLKDLSIEAMQTFARYYELKSVYSVEGSNFYYYMHYLNADGAYADIYNTDRASEDIAGMDKYVRVEGSGQSGMSTNIDPIPENAFDLSDHYSDPFEPSDEYELVVGVDTSFPYTDRYSEAYDSYNKEINYVYVGMRGVKLQEVCGKDGQLTHINEKVLEGKYVAVPEKTDIISDGVKIEGFVIKPIDYDENKRYPAIVDVHGGPRTAFGSVFFHEMQYWASMGYFVMFTNMRGSDGRGNEFADLRGKYGTIDFDDLMRFVDAVLEKYPQIDDKKVGITGGSYGGFMTNWAIGNTNRFAAAASQRSLTNWISLTNLADIGYTFDQEEVQGTAWRNMKRIWDQSPLKHANKAKTPTLFIHSEEDYRCLLSEGMQMFYAIKNAGCTARMCIFKGENHELSRSGKPIHRTRRLKEITQWFEKYLKGAK